MSSHTINYQEKRIVKFYIDFTTQYTSTKEPTKVTVLTSDARFIELAKPHITLRATFSIAKKTVFPVELDKNFIEWFTAYKQPWLEHHNIKKWDSIDENSAPLLAVADHTEDINPLKFHKILRNGN